MNPTYKFNVGDKQFQFSNIDVVNVIDSGMVLPQFKSLKDKEIKECDMVCKYKCDSEKCNFDTCLSQMRESAELKARGLKNTSIIVTEVIKNNQELFTTKEVGGFVLQAGGNGQLFIQNDTFAASDTTRVGLLDLTETRRRFIHQHELQKLNSWNSGQILIGGVFGSLAGAGGAFFAMKLFMRHFPK